MRRNERSAEPLVKTDFEREIVDVLRLESVDGAFVDDLKITRVGSHAARDDVEPVVMEDRRGRAILIGVLKGHNGSAVVTADEAVGIELVHRVVAALIDGRAHSHADERSKLGNSRDVAKNGDGAKTTEVVQLAVEHLLVDAGASAIERRRVGRNRVLEHALDLDELRTGHGVVGLTDKVSHVDATSAQVHDVDGRASRDLFGTDENLTLGHEAARRGGTLRLEDNLDAVVVLHTEGGLVAIADVLLIGDLIEEV